MTFKIGLCQSTTLSEDRRENLKRAAEMVREAAEQGAGIVALPEMFTTPYTHKYIAMNREPADGETTEALSSLARDLGIWLVGGSIPEEEDGRLYNTCFVFGPDGSLAGKHRKTHLFDVDIKGGIRFMESEIFTPGEQVTAVDTDFGRIGVGICYDVRFPEYFRTLALMDARLIVLPAAFNMTTGPAHWDLTMRARALDNQVYFAAVSPARNPQGPYLAYGGSCVVTPWGEFLGKLDERPGVLVCDIDFEYLRQIREQLPLLKQRRPELYLNRR